MYVLNVYSQTFKFLRPEISIPTTLPLEDNLNVKFYKEKRIKKKRQEKCKGVSETEGGKSFPIRFLKFVKLLPSLYSSR